MSDQGDLGSVLLWNRGQDSLQESHRFREARQWIVGLFLVFERRDAFEFHVDQSADEAGKVDDSAAYGRSFALGGRRGHVFDVEVEQAVAALADRAQQVGSDANGVSDVDAQADTVVERLDGVVDALGRREVTVARARDCGSRS